MTIGGAMNTAVSALQAQSQQLAMISGNLGNSSTTGYKSTNASFATLLTGENSQNYSGGGVVAYSSQSVSAQGNIVASTVSTNVAIDGQGMFPVTYDKDKSELYFTRDGEFAADSNGNLTNNGYYLMGWPTDSSGNVQSTDTTSVNGLQTINVNRYSSSASASTTETLKANLPADAASGTVLSSSVSIYDALGTSQTVPVTWTKSTTANEWTMTLGDPVNATSGTQTGTIGGNTTYTVTFGSDGSLSSIKDSGGAAVTTPTITVSSWTDGATASAVEMNLGTAGKADGLTQYSSGSTTAAITIKSSTANGYAYGQLTGVTIGNDGVVTANYDNGQTMAIYKIPVATFANENGMLSMSDNVYQVTGASGGYTLQEAGTGGAGKIDGSSLESSTVDTSSQFSLMIVAQQAYSAASQVISASKTMYDDLIQAVR
jgi:flagellar hook protein FlgE